MNLLWLLVVLLIVAALIGAPAGPGLWANHSYGWYPSGGIGLVVVILVILLLLGRL